jgi:hypothetical protein
MTGTATRVLRYLDRPTTKAGLPYANMDNEVMGCVLDFGDGVRVRHWVDGNSVKACNEGNTFRVEATMNQPGMFQVHRRAQGEPETTPKRRLPRRKGGRRVRALDLIGKDRALLQALFCVPARGEGRCPQ